MPSSKTKKTTSKTKQSAADKKLRRFRGVVMPYAGHKSIRAVRRAGHEPSIHGTKLWKSSCLIIDYLKKASAEAPQARAGCWLRLGHYRHLVRKGMGVKGRFNGCRPRCIPLP